MPRRGPLVEPYTVSLVDAESVRLGLPQIVRLRVNSRNASVAGRYDNAIKQAMRSRSGAPLRPFRGKVIVDVRGQRWSLITDLDAYRRAWETLTDDEQEDFGIESP